MADHKYDIDKYRKGELTSAEMHALEKKALSDPFLADAMEGVESISTEDFTTDLSEINKKLKSHRKKIVWFTPLRIAAGIVLVVGSVFLIYTINQPEEQLALQKVKSPVSNVPSLGDTTSKKEQLDLLSLNQPKEENKPKSKTDQKSKSDPTASKADGTGATKPTGGISSSETIQASTDDQIKADQDAQSKLAEIVSEENLSEGEKITAAEPSQQDLKKEISEKKIVSRMQAKRSKLANENMSQKIVTGQVTSSEDGLPLPGVNVTIKGTTTGAVTDMQGNYAISLENEKQKLVFSFIGLQSSEVSPNDNATLNVKLLEDASQLSEVVVTGHGYNKSSLDEVVAPVIKLAEPLGGRKAYNKYLENNLRYPAQALENKIKGKVTIEFTVGTNGELRDFNVMKSLGYGCDEEVVRLLKDGPKWSPSIEDNVALESNVRVKMKFDAGKSRQ